MYLYELIFYRSLFEETVMWGVTYQVQSFRSSSKFQIKLKVSEMRADRVAQVVECLSNKHHALSSKPSTTKNCFKVSEMEWEWQKIPFQCVSFICF
jgi:hypothetical protein